MHAHVCGARIRKLGPAPHVYVRTPRCGVVPHTPHIPPTRTSRQPREAAPFCRDGPFHASETLDLDKTRVFRRCGLLRRPPSLWGSGAIAPPNSQHAVGATCIDDPNTATGPRIHSNNAEKGRFSRDGVFLAYETARLDRKCPFRQVGMWQVPVSSGLPVGAALFRGVWAGGQRRPGKT